MTTPIEKQPLTIGGIPALLWGPDSGRLFIAVHGDGAYKEDEATAVFAQEALQKGWQTLSFDLPEHGDCSAEARPATPQNCVEDLGKMLAYAQGQTEDLGLFAVSLGAWFSLLAYSGAPLGPALLLSPVVDMEKLILGMMGWFGVSEERLEREGSVETPAKTLSWETLRYVRTHPVAWARPTAILMGEKDMVSDGDSVAAFAARTGSSLRVMAGGEHYFHTGAQLAFFGRCLRENLRE